MVIDWVKSCEPKPLVIVDSFVSFHPGDENDAGETRDFTDGFRRLGDLGATVLVLHHIGKGGGDYRGSSDIPAGLDVGYRMTNLSDDPSRLGPIKIKAWKARFSTVNELYLEYRDGAFEPSGTRPQEELLTDLLRQNPRITQSKFENMASTKRITRVCCRPFLEGGVMSRRIRREPGPHNAQLHTWVGDAKKEDSNEVFCGDFSSPKT